MNLYSLLEKGFPKDKKACAIETQDGLLYSWSDVDRATAMMANLLKNLKPVSYTHLTLPTKRIV